MIKHILTTLAFALLFTACGETKEEVKNENQNEGSSKTVVAETDEIEPELTDNDVESESEELINMENPELESDDMFDNLCSEEVVSDCYIVDHFQYMKSTYINVDFVNYKVLSVDSEPELVNEIKTIRTFLVADNYDDCSGEHSESTVEMLAKAKENPFTLFSLEANEGVVGVLFEKKCEE